MWQRRDGTTVELAVSASPMRGGSGEPSGVVLVARDVSGRNAAMATFSHELRTPLAAILGFTEILMTRASDDDVNKTTLEMMHSEAKRLSSLMGQFLDAQELPEVERRLRSVSPPGTESPRAPSRR